MTTNSRDDRKGNGLVVGLVQWARTHPQTIATIERLHAAGVRCGIFSSTILTWYNPLRRPRDIDLLMHPDDFERFLRLVPSANVKRGVCIKMHNDHAGHAVSFWAHEATAMLDGQKLQVMRPLTPVYGGAREYELQLSGFAAEHIAAHEAGHSTIYAAHLFDTFAAKILLGRSPQQGKQDLEDARVLAQYIDFSEPYVIARAAELGMTEDQLAHAAPLSAKGLKCVASRGR